MYPETEIQSPPSQDFLSKIKANKKQAAIVGGGIFLLITLLSVVLAAIFQGGTSMPVQLKVVQTHLSGLTDATEDHKDKLINETIREQNAAIGTLTASAANSLSTLLMANYGEVQLDKETAATAAVRLTEFEAGMNESVVTNTTDATYQLLMASELQYINGRLAQIAAQSSPQTASVLLELRKQLTEARNRLQNVEL